MKKIFFYFVFCLCATPSFAQNYGLFPTEIGTTWIYETASRDSDWGPQTFYQYDTITITGTATVGNQSYQVLNNKVYYRINGDTIFTYDRGNANYCRLMFPIFDRTITVNQLQGGQEMIAIVVPPAAQVNSRILLRQNDGVVTNPNPFARKYVKSTQIVAFGTRPNCKKLTISADSLNFVFESSDWLSGIGFSYIDHVYPFQNPHDNSKMIGTDNTHLISFFTPTEGWVGTDNVLKNGIKTSVSVFPNPAADYFNIEIPIAIENARFKVFNLLGQEVYSVKLNNSIGRQAINTTSWQSGCYFYQIANAEALIDKGKIEIVK